MDACAKLTKRKPKIFDMKKQRLEGLAETQDEVRLLKKAAASVGKGGKKEEAKGNKGGFPGNKKAKWAA